MANCLVTGGGGFIGAHLVEALVAAVTSAPLAGTVQWAGAVKTARASIRIQIPRIANLRKSAGPANLLRPADLHGPADLFNRIINGTLSENSWLKSLKLFPIVIPDSNDNPLTHAPLNPPRAGKVSRA